MVITNRIKDICTRFTKTINFVPHNGITLQNATYTALKTECFAYDNGEKWFLDLCYESAAIAELAYPTHSPEIRLQVARYTWYTIYLDNFGSRFHSSMESFQHGILACQSPDNSFFSEFRELLRSMHDLWDSLPASKIIISACDFVNGCLMEQTPAIMNMSIPNAAISWPYYLRNKTGSAAAYAFMLFPKDLGIHVRDYIQVIDNISLFINLGNDILSLYKEELAGERNNYIHNRANVLHKDVIEVLEDVVNETLDAYERVTEALRGTKAYSLWMRFVNGYIAFHYLCDRYRLSDIKSFASTP